MTSVQKCREATKAEIGAEFSEETFQLALAKAKRWMKNAYGSVDLEEFIAETGGSVGVYYRECVKNPNGRDTFNRQTQRSAG